MAQTKIKLIADGVIDVNNLKVGHTITTDNIGEGTNLYYTDARVQAAGNALYLPLAGGTLTGNLIVNANVGIGMTPAKTLDLQNTDNLAIRLYNGASFKAGIEVATTAGDMVGSSAIDDLGIRSQSNILFATGGNTERLRIDASGNLLVGLTSGGKFSVSYGGGNDTHFGLGANYDNYITAGSSGVTIFRNGTTERMRIDSSGRVGVGTTSPAPFAGNGATLQLSGSSTTSELRLTRGDGTDLSLIAGSANGGGVLQTNTASVLRFGTDNTERMRIDANGNVGIGTSSPYSTANHTSLTIDGTSVSRTEYRTGGTSRARFLATSSTVQLGSTQNIPLIFETGASSTERMRIDSSGNILINKTSFSNASAGVVIRSDVSSGGQLRITRENNTDPQSQILFYTNGGSGIGNISTTSSSVIYNTTAAGTVALTSSGLTFDAGTHYLDDYEEGTWSPVLKWGSGGTYTMTGITSGVYTKIGRVVTVSFQIQWSALVGTYGAGNLIIDGLPFYHIASTRSAGSVGGNLGGSLTFSNSAYTQWILVMDPNAAFVYVIEMGNTYSHQPTVASSGIVYGFSITYQVN